MPLSYIPARPLFSVMRTLITQLTAIHSFLPLPLGQRIQRLLQEALPISSRASLELSTLWLLSLSPSFRITPPCRCEVKYLSVLGTLIPSPLSGSPPVTLSGCIGTCLDSYHALVLQLLITQP